MAKSKKNHQNTWGAKRTSSFTNALGDSGVRQRLAVTNAAAQHLKTKIPQGQWLEWVGVSGKTPLHQRAGIDKIVEKAKSQGEQTLVVENHTRLARSLDTQMDALKFCNSKGIRVLHAVIPDLFVSENPTMVFLRNVLGAASQLEHGLKVEELAAARRRAKQNSDTKTLMGQKKCEGRKNFQELYPKLPVIVNEILKKPYAKRVVKHKTKVKTKMVAGRACTWVQLSKELFMRGIKTMQRKSHETGKRKAPPRAISKGQLRQWMLVLDKKK